MDLLLLLKGKQSCASDLRFAAAVQKLVLLVQIGGGRAGPPGYRPGPLSSHQPRLRGKQACIELNTKVNIFWILRDENYQRKKIIGTGIKSLRDFYFMFCQYAAKFSINTGILKIVSWNKIPGGFPKPLKIPRELQQFCRATNNSLLRREF